MDEPGRVETLFYNKEQDCFYCPMGQPMKKIGSYKKKTDTGFEQEYSRYQAKNCGNCPLLSICHKSKDNRIIDVNHELNRLKAKAKELLLSEEGVKHRKQRPANVAGSVK